MSTPVKHDERLEAYARLAVRVGANVSPGQLVQVLCLVEHAPLARAIVREAYAAAASYVEVTYGDAHTRRELTAADYVSIHAPTRGATHRLNDQSRSIQVSIHAPTRGATSTPLCQHSCRLL